MGRNPESSRVTHAWRRTQDWVLLSGNRYVVTGLVIAVVVVAGFVVRPFAPVEPTDATPLFYAFGAILGGNLNLLTIVLSINQLVFSRELQPPGKFRDIDASVEEFRADVADAVGEAEADALPVRPAPFARRLVVDTEDHLDDLRDALDGRSVNVDDGVTRQLDRLADDLDFAIDCLDDPGSVTFSALEATLRVAIADSVHALGTLRREHGDDLGDAGRDALAGVHTDLRLVTVAREYFKSLYTQEELSKLSVVLLLVGVPAQVALAFVLFEMVGLFQSRPPDVFAPWLLYVALAVGFVPLALLFSYVLRAATVAHRSATTTQFAGPPREGEAE